MEEMVTWLTKALKDKGWSLRELGRRANISHATISNILSGQSNPGLDFCIGIAKAFNIPTENVMRMAGILPTTNTSTKLEELTFLYEQLNESDKDSILTMVRGYVNERTSKYPDTKGDIDNM